MNTIARLVLAALVLVTLTAAPASAAVDPHHPSPMTSAGLCRLWPKLCS